MGRLRDLLDGGPRCWLRSDDPGAALVSARHARHLLEQRLHGLDAKRLEILAAIELEDANVARHEQRAAEGPPRLSDHVARAETVVREAEKLAEHADKASVAHAVGIAVDLVADVRKAAAALELPDVVAEMGKLEQRCWKARALAGLPAAA